MNLIDLDTFLRVIDTGSFTQAASALGVPKSTVSRRVARLEDQLGLELLTRQGRSFTVSPYGRQLHARCAHALSEIADAERALADMTGEPAGLLRVSVVPDLAVTPGFAQLVAQFRARYPKVTLELDLSTRRVDIIGEGFDAAFRAHAGPLADSSSLVARRLMGGVGRIYASPAYLERRGRPRSPRDLVRHDCVVLAIPEFDAGWPMTQTTADAEEIAPLTQAIRANDFIAVLELAIAGCGVALLPTFVAEPRVATGELVSVLPRWKTTTGQVSLVWPLSRYPSPRVRAFVEHTTEVFAANKAACEHLG